MGLPRWPSSKESTYNAGDVCSILGLRRSSVGQHGNPLQYSCLENLMDRGARWATVHRVAKSRTWLKWLSTHACQWLGLWALTAEDLRLIPGWRTKLQQDTEWQKKKKNHFICISSFNFHNIVRQLSISSCYIWGTKVHRYWAYYLRSHWQSWIESKSSWL